MAEQREPSPSWETRGLESKLTLNRLRVVIEPNGDRSGWLWEIRVLRGSGTCARTFTSLTSIRAAQLEAEAALLALAAEIVRVVGVVP